MRRVTGLSLFPLTDNLTQPSSRVKRNFTISLATTQPMTGCYTYYARRILQIIDADAISDPEIRKVYCDDILEMSRQVQAHFGLLPFLFEGNLANVTGFYEFRIWSLDKNIVSNGRK